MASKTTKSKVCADCGAGNTYTKVSGVVVCRTCGWQSEEGADLNWKSPDVQGPTRMSRWVQELLNTPFVNLDVFKAMTDTFKFFSEIETEYGVTRLEKEVVKWREWHEDNKKKPKSWRSSLRNWLTKAKEGPTNGGRKAEAKRRITAGKPTDSDPFAGIAGG